MAVLTTEFPSPRASWERAWGELMNQRQATIGKEAQVPAQRLELEGNILPWNSGLW